MGMAGHEPQPQKHHVWGQPTKKWLRLFAQLRFGVSVPCSLAKTSPPAPTLGPIQHHLGKQLQALSGSCGSQSVPQLPAPTTIWDCAGLHQCVLAETPSGTAMGRAHGADGSQGASGTSLSWTHCRDISGTRDCPSTQTAALWWAGALPSPVKGQLSTGDAGIPPQMPRGKVSSAHFPRVQVQGQQTPTSMLSHDPALSGAISGDWKGFSLNLPPFQPLWVGVPSPGCLYPPHSQSRRGCGNVACGVLPGYKQGKILGKQTPWQSRCK